MGGAGRREDHPTDMRECRGADRVRSQYCQTIRNNNNAARTPKWAVKYGLVKVKDKRGGKSQWASRYDGASILLPLHASEYSSWK